MCLKIWAFQRLKKKKKETPAQISVDTSTGRTAILLVREKLLHEIVVNMAIKVEFESIFFVIHSFAA